MRQKYFKKDKKAMVYKVMPGTRNEYGAYTPGGYMPISDKLLWCYAKQKSQTLRYNAGIVDINTENRLFIFNNNKHIAIKDFIKYNGEWYKITRVDTDDDYNSDMYVTVEDAKVGEEPKDTEIKPYDPSKLV